MPDFPCRISERVIPNRQVKGSADFSPKQQLATVIRNASWNMAVIYNGVRTNIDWRQKFALKGQRATLGRLNEPTFVKARFWRTLIDAEK
jgi:hypothetical protein